ncbi:hypothetical protein GCM10010524_00570 [Streptomyces mexicanus]
MASEAPRPSGIPAWACISGMIGVYANRPTPIAAARAAAPRSTVGHGEPAREAVGVTSGRADACFMITFPVGPPRTRGFACDARPWAQGAEMPVTLQPCPSGIARGDGDPARSRGRVRH